MARWDDGCTDLSEEEKGETATNYPDHSGQGITMVPTEQLEALRKELFDSQVKSRKRLERIKELKEALQFIRKNIHHRGNMSWEEHAREIDDYIQTVAR
jgi:hypothetical protein